MTTLPKDTSAATILTCAECGEEAQIVGAWPDDTADDIDQIVEDWNAAHLHCGEPAELTEWTHLSKSGDSQTLIKHGGDLEKMMPLPRPTWADRERDQIGTSLTGSCYRSTIASVPVTHAVGWSFLDDQEWVTARVNVSAKLFGNGVAMVGLTLAKPATEAGGHVGVSLTVDEARQLADVLTAAAKLAVSH